MTAIHRALEIIDGDRNEQYGEPERNLGAIAGMWTIYLSRKGSINLDGADVAVMMSLLKAVREAGRKQIGEFDPEKDGDNFTDGIGYLELAARLRGFVSDGEE